LSGELAELLRRVRQSHDRHFGHTALSERFRDLQHQVAELVHQVDPGSRPALVGKVGWSLLQLCVEEGVDLGAEVDRTIASLDGRSGGRRVALIGTSANPITNAHLTMGLEVLALTDVDEVWYSVVGRHAWGKPLMPAHHRVEMVRRATARYPRLRVCDFEVEHIDRIFAETTETSEILRRFMLPAFPHCRFRWVMGSDVAQSFHRWGGVDWMAAHIPVIIIHRLGYDFEKAGSPLADARHVYLREDIVTSNISSTLVRSRGRDYDQGRVMALVPDIVWDYLVEHRLLDPEVLRV